MRKRKETEPDDGSRKTKSRRDLLPSFLTKQKKAKNPKTEIPVPMD